MKSTLITVLILLFATIQLGYAEPWHRNQPRASHNRAFSPQDQDNWLGGTGNWSDGTLWSLNAPPGSGDDATIGSATDYVYFDVGTATVNSLTLGGTLTNNGIASQFTASFALNVTSTGVFDFSASTISLPSYMQGSVNYGKISAAGLSVSGYPYGGHFWNYGVATLGGLGLAQLSGAGNSGQMDLYTGLGMAQYASFENDGTLTIHGANGGGLSLDYTNSFVNKGTFNNAGSIFISLVHGGANLQNDGLLNNAGGSIVAQASLQNDGTLLNTGSVVAGAAIGYGGLGGSGSYIQYGAQSSTVVEGTLGAGSPIQINGGTLSGSGIIAADVNMSGTLHAGDHNGCHNNPCKTLTIQDNYQQFGIGTLYSELGGLQAGTDYDQLVITGNAALDGTLDVALINSFVPKVGDSFLLMLYGSEGGKFATLDLPSLPPGETWDYAYESSDFKLWVTPTPEPSSVVLLGSSLVVVAGALRRKLF